MKKFIQSRSVWEIIVVSALSFFAIAGFVIATTTIGTNITTGGAIYATSTLYVDGESTFSNIVHLSNASSTLANFGNGTTVAGLMHGTCANVTIASVAASSTAIFNCAVTGLGTTYKVFVTPYITDKSIIFSSASTTATGFQIAVYNTGWVSGVPGAATTLTSHDWSWFAIK
jgi:hypothetical protein